VLLDASTSDGEVQEVQHAFAAAGVEADVQATYERKGIGEFPWIVMITAPAAAFFTAIAAAAGKDAYRVTKNLVWEVWTSRARGSGSRGDVILRDEDTGVWIALESDLPTEAYEKLAGLDLTRFETDRFGYLKYDRERGEWRPPTEE
jgi:hypothetical protein